MKDSNKPTPKEIHIYVKGDEKNHIADMQCSCQPTMRVDTKTGDIIWVHQIGSNTNLFDGFIKM